MDVEQRVVIPSLDDHIFTRGCCAFERIVADASGVFTRGCDQAVGDGFDFVDIDAVFESVEHVEAYRAYYFRFCGFNSVARGIVS